MQRIAALLRGIRSLDTNAPSPVELNQRAREVVDAIDNETGQRTAHSQRVARLYSVARDIQHARAAGAKDITVHEIVKFLGDVFARTYLPRLCR
jgi:hypothetical protein